jgi:hypothetical protein
MVDNIDTMLDAHLDRIASSGVRTQELAGFMCLVNTRSALLVCEIAVFG